MIADADLLEAVLQASALSLFLDYDGTLAEFAPSPDHIEPKGEVIDILERLSRRRRVTIAIVSGRHLEAVEALVPVAGITIAGSYGIELKLPDGTRVDRLGFETVRPLLERLKPQWSELIAASHGFFLEDKGWSLALHGRFAPREEAERVFAAARELAERPGIPKEYRLLGGERFLEMAPRGADKGAAVEYLLSGNPAELAGRPLYVGDDDKDLEAFAVVHRYGGYTALVGSRYPEAEGAVDCRFADPAAVRAWLRRLSERLRPD